MSLWERIKLVMGFDRFPSAAARPDVMLYRDSALVKSAF